MSKRTVEEKESSPATTSGADQVSVDSQKPRFKDRLCWSGVYVTFILLLCAAVFLISAIYGSVVLQDFPNSADEYAYLFQGENFSKGRVFSDLHPKGGEGEHLQKYFYFVHIGENEGRYYGRFPPGYSILLGVALALGVPTYFVNALLAALTFLFVALTAREIWGKLVGLLSGLILVVNPWFLLNSGSYFSHTAAGAFVAGSIYFFVRSIYRKEGILLIFSGMFFGFSVLIRLLDPLPVLGSFLAFYFLFHTGEGRKLARDVAFFCIGGLPFLLFFLWYNAAITGDMLTTPYQFYNPDDQSTRFIFFDLENGGQFNFSRVFEIGWPITRDNLKLISEWFPAVVLLIFLPFLYMREFLRGDKLSYGFLSTFVLMAIGIVVLYTLYGGPPVNQYGPRYFYITIIPLSIIGARSLQSLFPASFSLLSLIPLAVLLDPSLQAVKAKSEQASVSIFKRRDIFRLIEKEKLENAVIFVTTGSDTLPTCDLPRNGVDFDREVLIAQSLGGEYDELMRYYSDRNFYEYRYDEKTGGMLTPLQ